MGAGYQSEYVGGGVSSSPPQCAVWMRKRCTAAYQQQAFTMPFDTNSKYQSIAAFLIVRGPIAFLGFGWESGQKQWDSAFANEVGTPTGLCAEKQPGVFERQWSYGSVSLDCNNWTAKVPTKDPHPLPPPPPPPSPTPPPMPGSVMISMNNAAIVFSPFTWAVNSSRAKTINAGAYFRLIFSGQRCVLHTDTQHAGGWSGLHGPVYSEFYTRVDGGPLQGPHLTTPGNPSFNVSLGPPFGPRSSSPNHLLEVVVKATSETVNRWEGPTGQDSAVIFTGIELTEGSAVVAPRRKPFNTLIFGDSITEGVRALGYTGDWQGNDTDRNDATRDYSFQLSLMLPTEVGIVGFGGQGLHSGGSGRVPSFGDATKEPWRYLWDGEPRDFVGPAPDLIVYNQGANDGEAGPASVYSSLFIGVVRGLVAAAPSARHLILLPFNQENHRADILRVVKALNNPNVTFGDTKGFYDGEDGEHPFGYSHIGQIAPQMAALCLPLLGSNPPMPAPPPPAPPPGPPSPTPTPTPSPPIPTPPGPSPHVPPVPDPGSTSRLQLRHAWCPSSSSCTTGCLSFNTSSFPTGCTTGNSVSASCPVTMGSCDDASDNWDYDNKTGQLFSEYNEVGMLGLVVVPGIVAEGRAPFDVVRVQMGVNAASFAGQSFALDTGGALSATKQALCLSNGTAINRNIGLVACSVVDAKGWVAVHV